jgi:hypothetical protein
MIRSTFIVTILGIITASTALGTTATSSDVENPRNLEINKKCVMCHMKENKSLVLQWENSPHANTGEGQVGCYTCHAADKGDELGHPHEGVFIKTILSPNDCRRCHERETKQMTQSRHAAGGEIIASLDYLLAEVVAGMPNNEGNVASGCWQCHGSVVALKRDKDGKILRSETGAPLMDNKTWPNTGIGRINPDGTRGACNACHSRHSFRASVSRQPENCGKCHQGPKHPQKEIYEESKHGIAFFTAQVGEGRNAMNILKEGKWVLGDDYYVAPTCATCHMGSFVKLNGSSAPSSHNVGDRISWNLRTPISNKMNRVTFTDGSETDILGETPPRAGQKAKYQTYVREGNKLKKVITAKTIRDVVTWEQRRANMQEVCKSCHGINQIQDFYEQFDDLIYLYNEKFAKPGKMLVDELQKDGIWENTGLHHKLGFTWFEIWHHQGRRARMAVAMHAPNYTFWQGMYEVARDFYLIFLPGVQELANQAGKGEKYKKVLQDLTDKPEHRWIRTGGSAESMKLIEEEQKLRYND